MSLGVHIENLVLALIRKPLLKMQAINTASGTLGGKVLENVLPTDSAACLPCIFNESSQIV